jgi:hypothetical protein
LESETKRISIGPGGRINMSPEFRNRLLGLLAVYALFALTFDASLWPTGYLTTTDHVHLREAQGWLEGRMSLPARDLDTALYKGKVYSHFPPAMTFLSYFVLQVSPEGVPFWLTTLLFVLPVPALAYSLFLKRSPTVLAAVVMTCAYVLGTSEFTILHRAVRSAAVWQLNHAISQVGLLLLLNEYFGRRRVWSGGIGLLLCGWSRMPMGAYVVPFLASMYSRAAAKPFRVKAMAAGFVVLMVGTLMTLNTLKFDSPFETGYGLIYEGRTDRVALSAKDGAFSPKFIPQNLYWINLGFPSFEKYRGEWRWEPSIEATGIWWTTPLLLFVFLDGRRIWRDRDNRWLLAAVGVIYTALLCYHTTGYAQRGYNRFSLDFLLPLLVMIAPYAFVGRRRIAVLLAVGWSVVYFRWIIG